MSCLARQLSRIRLHYGIRVADQINKLESLSLSTLHRQNEFNVISANSNVNQSEVSNKSFASSLTGNGAESGISRRLSEDEEQALFNEREFQELSPEMYESICKDEFEREKMIQALAEYELNKYDTGRVPTQLTLDEMRMLIDLEAHQVSQRAQLLIYFYKRELAKMRDRQQREQRKREVADRLALKYQTTQKSTGLEYLADGTPVYGKWRNTMFVHKSDRAMRSMYESRAANAAIFGPRIVFDFGFEHEMERRELTNLGLQISLAFADNLRAREPFDLWFCNLKKGTSTEKILLRNIGNMYDAKSLINVTEKSYLDVFDASKLIYLSPHATKVLRDIPGDAVFVIGCIVDRARIVPLTSTKAAEEKVNCYKLPLDDYLFFKGKKTLTVNQVFCIMNSAKQDGDWQRAFDEHVPKRKLKTLDQVKEEQERKIRKFLRKSGSFRHPDTGRPQQERRGLFDAEEALGHESSNEAPFGVGKKVKKTSFYKSK